MITTKLSREFNSRPPTVKKRSYKNFSKENFLLEVRNTNFDKVINQTNSNEAAKVFSDIFGQILDNHAPIKVFQSRRNYAPWLSDETKLEIVRRNELKRESILSNDYSVLKNYKQLRNSIKAKLKKEEQDYYRKKFEDSHTKIKDVWKYAYDILGQYKNSSPTQVNYEGRLIKSCNELAETFNEIVLNKVKNLKTAIPAEFSSS